MLFLVVNSLFILFAVLNIGLINIFSHFCFSLILTSIGLCADPIIKKDDLTLYVKWRKSLLKEGIYAPSRLSLIANLKWFDMKNLIFFLLQ